MTEVSVAQFAGDFPGDPVDSYDLSPLGLGTKPTRALLLALTGVTSTCRLQSPESKLGGASKFQEIPNPVGWRCLEEYATLYWRSRAAFSGCRVARCDRTYLLVRHPT
jgi:hypothetical protein